MGTATVSELPGVAGAQKTIEILKLNSTKALHGSERFWRHANAWVHKPDNPTRDRLFLHFALLGVVATATIIPIIRNSPLDIKVFRPSINTPSISASISTYQHRPFSENYLKPRITTNTALSSSAVSPETTASYPKSYLTNLINEVVNDKRLGILDKDKEFWKKRLRQIIAVESSEDHQAFSGKAYGLTQLRPETAAGLAKKHGIAEYDLLNPWDNSFLGLLNQLDLAKRYDTELGAWAHHLGSGNMDIALRTYLIADLKLKVKDADDIFQSNETVLKAIRNYKITPSRLLNSPHVTGKLKEIGAFGDNTDIYYSKLMAVSLPQTKG